MTPQERYEYQRRNRRALYIYLSGVVVLTVALSFMRGLWQ